MQILKSLSFVTAVLLLASCATAKLSHDERDALKVLQRYVQLDRSGARLDSNRYHSIAALTTWQEEPGWDAFLVTSGLGIGRPQVDGEKIVCHVRYEVEGVMEGDTFTPISGLDQETIKRFGIGSPVTFTLVPTSEGWKVESPLIAPHVGFAAARALAEDMHAENVLDALSDAEYMAKLKGARAGHCNCERLDF